MPVKLNDIDEARRRIRSGVIETPCAKSAALSELCRSQIYSKLEYLQRTGSFKERGACNALLQLDAERAAKGVIAASAGNHALALAYHGTRLGISAKVVMPRFAPLIKQVNCEKLGATIILHGDSFAEAKKLADQIALDEGRTYIHGYDDPAIIAGQGTIGLEILEQVPDAEAIIVPVGGGGLLAGVALAVKSLRPDIQIIAVEPEHAPCFEKALEAGKVVDFPTRPTLADGLAIARMGENAFQIAAPLIDKLVLVSEQQIALSIVRLMEYEKSVVEGGGAASLAALLSGQCPELVGKRVVLILSGGNIDMSIVDRLIDVALVADDRLVRFTAVISDRPGGLAKLATLIGQAGASIQEVTHDRTFAGPNVAAVHVHCTVETRDRAHIEQLLALLQENGIPCYRTAPIPAQP